ncbi:MAG: TlpA family protein disulfide reductase [Burkholderiales bacterium]|nr:TlpA family protein disulfide reductase [Burkholderiales bacterium]
MIASNPHPSRRRLLGGAAALLCAGLPAAYAQGEEDPVKTIHWPTLPVVGGGVLRTEDWAGVAAIVVFWATWCPYCKRHNARMNALFHTLGDRPIRIVGVATGESEAKVAAYVRMNALDFPQVIGSAELKMQFTNRKVVPLTGLVRGDGKLVQVIPGELTDSDVLSLPSLISDRAA